MSILNLLNTGSAQYTGWLGGYEILAIVVVILLLFGGKKIPELMRGIGKGIKEFKGGISENGDADTGKTKSDDKNKTEEK